MQEGIRERSLNFTEWRFWFKLKTFYSTLINYLSAYMVGINAIDIITVHATLTHTSYSHQGYICAPLYKLKSFFPPSPLPWALVCFEKSLLSAWTLTYKSVSNQAAIWFESPCDGAPGCGGSCMLLKCMSGPKSGMDSMGPKLEPWWLDTSKPCIASPWPSKPAGEKDSGWH